MKLSFLTQQFIDRINRDIIFTKASSLTYQTVLAIVPILAVMFGIAKGFGVESALEHFLRLELSEHKEVLDYLLEFSRTTLQEARGGIVAGTGVAVLLFTAMKLFSSVEATFNEMWGIKTPRHYLHKAVSYLALIVIGPLLLVAASSAMVFFANYLPVLTELPLLAPFKDFVSLGASLIPVIPLIVLFSGLFYIIPSANVSLRSVLLSGTIAACLFQLFQVWYIQLQLALTKMSAIYGSFVALPLFLAWLWMSWFIFLLSGEFCVALEERLWRFSKQSLEIDPKACAIALLSIVASHYRRGSPVGLPELIQKVGVSLKLFYNTLEKLKERGLLYEIVDDGSSIISVVPSANAFSYTIQNLIFDMQADQAAASASPFHPAPEGISHEMALAYRRMDELSRLIQSQPDQLVVEGA